DIEGDIDIQGGVIGSRINSGGNIQARYIEASTIRALGDISVRDEVLHGDIEINGLLSMSSPAGKIISSTISARKGIEAAIIGSEASRPCTLVIGVDSQAKELSELLGREIESRKNEQEAFRKEIEKLKKESKNYDGQIAHLAQIQDRGSVEQKSLQAQIEELKKKNELARLSQAEWEAKNLESKIKSAEESLNQLMEQQDQVTETILARQRAIKEQEQAIEGLNGQIEKIKNEANQENIKPFLKIRQDIHAGTMIKGKKASLIIDTVLTRVQFKERQATVEDESGQPVTLWEIIISDL
ncbi:MAG TPA: FapA family protein, partial [Thermodesulfobacteriota bacterium]|nr:FapA family protein [Thermodesulfobacteriota bacterium]